MSHISIVDTVNMAMTVMMYKGDVYYILYDLNSGDITYNKPYSVWKHGHLVAPYDRYYTLQEAIDYYNELIDSDEEDN
jgi:hypothetical protein